MFQTLSNIGEKESTAKASTSTNVGAVKGDLDTSNRSTSSRSKTSNANNARQQRRRSSRMYIKLKGAFAAPGGLAPINDAEALHVRDLSTSNNSANRRAKRKSRHVLFQEEVEVKVVERKRASIIQTLFYSKTDISHFKDEKFEEEAAELERQRQLEKDAKKAEKEQKKAERKAKLAARRAKRAAGSASDQQHTTRTKTTSLGEHLEASSPPLPQPKPKRPSHSSMGSMSLDISEEINLKYDNRRPSLFDHVDDSLTRFERDNRQPVTAPFDSNHADPTNIHSLLGAINHGLKTSEELLPKFKEEEEEEYQTDPSEDPLKTNYFGTIEKPKSDAVAASHNEAIVETHHPKEENTLKDDKPNHVRLSPQTPAASPPNDRHHPNCTPDRPVSQPFLHSAETDSDLFTPIPRHPQSPETNYTLLLTPSMPPTPLLLPQKPPNELPPQQLPPSSPSLPSLLQPLPDEQDPPDNIPTHDIVTNLTQASGQPNEQIMQAPSYQPSEKKKGQSPKHRKHAPSRIQRPNKKSSQGPTLNPPKRKSSLTRAARKLGKMTGIIKRNSKTKNSDHVMDASPQDQSSAVVPEIDLNDNSLTDYGSEQVVYDWKHHQPQQHQQPQKQTRKALPALPVASNDSNGETKEDEEASWTRQQSNNHDPHEDDHAKAKEKFLSELNRPRRTSSMVRLMKVFLRDVKAGKKKEKKKTHQKHPSGDKEPHDDKHNQEHHQDKANQETKDSPSYSWEQHRIVTRNSSEASSSTSFFSRFFGGSSNKRKDDNSSPMEERKESPVKATSSGPILE